MYLPQRNLTLLLLSTYIILSKCHKKTHVAILMNFLDKMSYLFFLKMEALRSKSDKQQSKYIELPNEEISQSFTPPLRAS